VHQAVAAGVYELKEVAIVAGLRLLEERERSLEEILAELRPTLRELDRGEGKLLDIENIIIRGCERLAKEGGKL
jgi:hypothetical protein